MVLAPATTAIQPTRQLPPLTPESRELAARVEARRLALQSDQQQLRDRYEEVMRWINPPWDPISRRLDPRGEAATAERIGENILHVDFVNPAVDRWAVLKFGAPVVFRVKPPFVLPPVENPDDPKQSTFDRRQFDFDSAKAQSKAAQMENQTQEWAEVNNLHRTLLWAGWAAEAFGKAIVKTGWDPDDKIPTAELYENPSTVYYGWTKRYGRRKLAWAGVVEEMDPVEVNRRFGLSLPTDEKGNLNISAWTSAVESSSELDQRPEQSGEIQRYVNAVEYYELAPNEQGRVGVRYALILAGRVIDGPTWFPWKRLPFHVLENQHIPTWSHGKSEAERLIGLNDAFDDTLDREHQIIKFEAGPRFKGLNMDGSGDDTDVPPPFHLVPLKPGEDIQQIDVGVDFFPAEVHMRALYEAKYRATGLTPIAWGMSPNAQTSGRAMSAEWRAVELPLHGKLITLTPEVKEIVMSWWDYAEAYLPDMAKVAQGYRRFEVIWAPLDIRDKTEKTADIINRLQANIIDPETAIQESGYENVEEIRAKIQAYLMNPIWNPLRYQQILTLQQLELTIRQQQLQVAALEAQAYGQGGEQPGAGAGQPGAEQLAQQGANAAGQAAQGVNPGGVGLNQPGQSPGGIPVETGILSQTPLEGGIGNRAIVRPGAQGPAPTAGQQPR